MKVGDLKKTDFSSIKSVVEQYQSVNVEITRTHNADLHNLTVPAYSDEEHGTWKLLHERQIQALPGRASPEFLAALQKLRLPHDRIPKLLDLSKILEDETGWKLARVGGLVPEKEFFELLSRRYFPCTDFIRNRGELEYTPSPDMFHDIFGHLPLITNPYFADFYESFGKAALIANAEDLIKLQKIYWFTVEFGLVQSQEGVRIYGSGILSGPGEVFYCLGPQVRRHLFDYSVIERQYYEIFHMQDDLFVIDSFEWLRDSFNEYVKKLSLKS